MVPNGAVFEMHFRLKIDDVALSHVNSTVGIFAPADTDYYYSVTFQYSNSSLIAGAHEVTVETERTCDGHIDNCCLLVQTYIT